ncbi:transporter substrate-binding domain-containing protein [Microbacterium rhizosphaerae]|uniref:Transporter substrate-binding domain-containing protein n=1 Tax=Microbacterium rhizosphaerae TaxID=1678237 RepID=A0ABZ0SMI8_9MICO|nr:transporter substrate-binding domain-containing protein [Microbacterium rhizosphaerae]WPR90338.1 transporter substrate-binding domain-containing protein [Microbacterium rhizosphaerae]
MNQRVLGLAAVAAAALLLSACSSGASDSGASHPTAAAAKAPAGLMQAGTLSVCIDPEYAPLEYYKNGSSGDVVGFDADGARALATYWGVTPKFDVTSFDGLMPALNASRCDIVWSGLYQSEARKAIADSSAYMQAGPTVVAAPALAAKLKAKDDLCGLRVVTQSASANSDDVAALSKACEAGGKKPITQSNYPQTAQTVLALINGKADALVETNVGAAYIVSQNEGKLAVAKNVFPSETTFGVFTRKGDKLSEPVAAALKALYTDGTFAKIAAQYKLDPASLDVSQ